MKKRTKLPRGWSEKRVRSVLAHYEHQSGEAAAAEDAAVQKSRGNTLIKVPTALVPQVRKLIARYHKPPIRRSAK